MSGVRVSVRHEDWVDAARDSGNPWSGTAERTSLGGGLAALPRPDLPPGPRRELVDALHGLHHRVGWPSLRSLATGAGCSHTTVSSVFSSPRMPSWGVLELIIEAMGGDVAEFHRLWLAASGPEAATPQSPARIAGRRAEVTAVCRHLETGAGLLLVTGEAGIGKSRLVETAALSTNGLFVARGSALPLSAQVPLLPITDALRSVYQADDGEWLKGALADCPSYVPVVMRRLLPELDEAVEGPAVQDDDLWRQRLFSAVASAWTALAATRPIAVLVEDLHWADSTTLDLLEHLLTVGQGIPIVGTWRRDDLAVRSEVKDWLSRVRRLPRVAELGLGPLNRDGTAEQLALLTGELPEPATVDGIYRRTAGQPLFTEQLVAYGGEDQQLPELLADLLDRRLEGLDDHAWRIARVLGVADRPLSDVLLEEVTSLPPTDLAAGLHHLADRRLLRSDTSRVVELRHPLLAEAIRRRLVGPEALDTHRRIAVVLSEAGDCEPAEVAVHWGHADDPRQEIVWRIRAARTAARRFAAVQESEQWLRVLELWPDGTHEAGDPPVTRARAHIAAMDALKAAMQFDRAADLSAKVTNRLTDVQPEDRAALLVRAADFRGFRESAVVGLGLVEQALEVLATLEPSEEYVRALDEQHNQLMLLNRCDEAHQVALEAVRAAESIDIPHLHRQMLSLLAWHEADAGDVARGLQTVTTAQMLLPAGADPRGDIRISAFHTDLLLRAGGRADEVEAAGAPGLAAAESAGIAEWQTNRVRSNVSEALTRAGFVGRAAALIDPLTELPFDQDRWPLHLERAHLDVLRGLPDAAQARLAPLRSDTSSVLHEAGGMLIARIQVVNYVAAIDLWSRIPERAFVLLQEFLDEIVETEIGGLSGPTFVLAARAAADLAERDGRPGVARDHHRSALGRLRERAPESLFRSTKRADGPATGESWRAETARLSGVASIPLWTHAASEWDKIDRPHDAAYCRWRGAQDALTMGEGRTAQRLLHRAAQQAGEHVPLATAISETGARKRRTQQRG
jgi:hypothetical protein